jgi:anti-sigma B factor antagonist
MTASDRPPSPYSIRKLPATLDVLTAIPLEKEMLATPFAPGERVIADMTEVKFVSSIGIRFLLVITDRLRKAGGEFLLTGLHPNVREVIAICGLEKILSIHGSVDEALAVLESLGDTERLA